LSCKWIWVWISVSIRFIPAIKLNLQVLGLGLDKDEQFGWISSIERPNYVWVQSSSLVPYILEKAFRGFRLRGNLTHNRGHDSSPLTLLIARYFNQRRITH
jgi:hypothetical protein